MANILKLETKRGTVYRIRVTDRRKGQQYSTTWPPKGETIPETWGEERIMKEVNKLAFEFEQKCLGLGVSTSHITFGEYAEYAIKQKERDSLKHKTAVRYRELLKRINDKKFHGIGCIKLKDLRPEDLNDFYTQLAKPGVNKRTGGYLSTKTIAEYHRLISSVLQMARREKKITENTAKLALAPKTKRKPMQTLEIADVQMILEKLKEQPLKYQAITHLLIATGARRGEIMGLKWEDVNFEHCSVNICRNLLYTPERGVYEDTTKTGIVHEITISNTALEVLKRWRIEQTEDRLRQGEYWKDTGYVFTQKDGIPMNPDTITQWLHKFSKRNDIPDLHPHLFRHTHASILLASNVDIVAVSQRLGHAKVSTTEDFYAHALKDADRKASDTFSRVLQGNMAM